MTPSTSLTAATPSPSFSEPAPPPPLPLEARRLAERHEARPVSPGQATLRALLSDRGELRALRAFLGRKVRPQALDDLVQDVCAAALGSASAPADPTACRKWLHGLGRHKRADLLEQQSTQQEQLDLRAEEERRRPAPGPRGEPPLEEAEPPAPLSVRQKLRWLDRQIKDGQLLPETLDWMVRQGEGEELKALGLAVGASPEAVRQRVFRGREALRRRWARDSAEPPPAEKKEKSSGPPRNAEALQTDVMDRSPRNAEALQTDRSGQPQPPTPALKEDPKPRAPPT